MGLIKRIKSHPGFQAEPVWFSLTQCLYWASNSALYSFVVMYLRSLGYSSAICGLATGSLWIFSLIVQPMMGYLTDTYISGKKLLLVFFAVAVPMTFVIPAVAGLGTLVLVALIGQSTLDNYQYCVIDAWIVQSSREKPCIDFGRIRSFGSLGYAVSALVMGRLIDGFGFWVMFVGHAVLLTLCALCLTRIDAVPCLNKCTCAGDKSLSIREVISTLIHNRTYLIFVISVALYQFGIRPSASYFSMVIASMGGGSSHVGLGTFVASFGEVFVMMVVSRLLRRGVRMELIYGVALLCGVLRLVVMSLPLGISALIAGQVLSSITVGTYIRVFAQYITELTPGKISGSATTLATALTYFCGGVIGNLSGGYLMDTFGTFGYIRICAASMALAFVAFLPTFMPLLRAQLGLQPVVKQKRVPARPRHVL